MRETADRLLVRDAHRPRALRLEVAREPAARLGLRHPGDHDAALRAVHPRHVGDQFDPPAAEILAPPAAHYDRERVMDCLSKANFGDRLKTLPDRLDTPLYKELDKNGVEVSGGEAQKIDIAGDKTAVYISPGCRRASSATTSPCSTMARSSSMARTTSSWPTKTASTTSCGMRRRSITSRSRCCGWQMHCRASAWAAARRCRPCRKAGKYGRPRPVRAAAGRSGRRARRQR